MASRRTWGHSRWTTRTASKVLVLGWGSTFGSIGAAVRRIRMGGGSVAQAHLRNLSPFPANLGDVLASYDKVLVPEINLGQLSLVLRGRYLTDVISYNRVRGLPFRAAELAKRDPGCDRQCLTVQAAGQTTGRWRLAAGEPR